MGSYSYLKNEEIFCSDIKGLKYLKEYNVKNKIPYWEILEIKKCSKGFNANALHWNYSVSFDKFDGLKIITYWYEDFLIFLRDVAQFLEGHVNFVFENDEKCARLEFEDGKVKIFLGSVQWRENTPESLGAPELSEKEKLMRAL